MMNPIDEVKQWAAGEIQAVKDWVSAEIAKAKVEIKTEIYEEAAENALSRLETLQPGDPKFKASLDTLGKG
jgi:hypothetical protein